MKKKLIENIFLTGGVQALSLLIPLVTLPYLAITLGPIGLGRMAFALSIAQVATIITDYGFNLSAPKLVALNRDDPDALRALVVEITIVRFGLCFLGLLTLLIGCLFVDRLRDDASLIIVSYIMVLGNILFPQWLFLGLERMRVISLMQISVRVGALGFLLGFVKNESDIFKAVLIQACVFTVAGIFAIPFVTRVIDFKRITLPSISKLKSRLSEGLPGFLSVLSVSAISCSNVIIMGFISPSDVIARFYVAEKLIRSVQIMYSPIVNSIYPYLSRLARENPGAAKKYSYKLLKISIPASFAISAFIFFFGPEFVGLIFGNRYDDSAGLLRLFSPLPFIAAISAVLGNLNMLPFGHEKSYGYIYIYAVLLNFLIFPWMVYTLSDNGAVIANLAVEAFISITMWLSIRNRSTTSALQG